MKLPLYTKITLLVVLVIVSSILVAADPPSLTDFQQFYGRIDALPNGTFTLKAAGGTSIYTTPIATDSAYGYSPVFKVYASGNPTITFYAINQLGVERQLGTVAFQGGEVTNLNFQYPSDQITPPPDTNPPANQTVANQTASSVSDDDDEEPAPTGTCLYSWICGLWTDCQNNIQTRTCLREDQCDQRLEQGEIAEVIPTPKPAEQRACTETAQQSAAICSASTKRCFGLQVQQCSADGQRWETLQTCATSCDAFTIDCKEAAPISSQTQKPFPSWIFPLIGSVVLLIVIIILLSFILGKKHKYAPAKEYIEEARMKGVSDTQIKSRLVDQGWDGQQIEKLLK